VLRRKENKVNLECQLFKMSGIKPGGQAQISKMNKTINIITLILGSIQVLAGLIKLLGIDNFSLNFGSMNMNVPINNGFLYIVFINFICGSAMIIHSILTLTFKKKLTLKNNPPNLKQLSLVGRLSGYIILVSSIWLIIENIAMLTGLEGKVLQFWPIVLFYLIIFLPFPIVPLILVSKNLSLNNEIGQKLDSIEKLKRVQDARNRE